MKYYKNMYWSSYKVNVTPVTFERNLKFQNNFRKTFRRQFAKILPVEVDLLYVDVRTDGQTLKS
jgi:hypothetical protein